MVHMEHVQKSFLSTHSHSILSYSEVILIGAGIGVTPYASILKHIVHISRLKESTNGLVLNKINFVWICPSKDSFECFRDLDSQINGENKNDRDDFIKALESKLNMVDLILKLI